MAAAMVDALDAFSAGMFLVDADGRIVHANAAGHIVPAVGDVLCSAGGRLAAREAEVDRSLRDMFAVAASSDTPIAALAVPLTALNGTRHVVQVLPLTSRARWRPRTTYAATAAVFVNEAVLDASSSPEIIAEAYRLTPTELRILLAIVEVGGVPDVAVALGIAESTVKTHLGRLFEKTGADRQADLVRIVVGFSNSMVR